MIKDDCRNDLRGDDCRGGIGHPQAGDTVHHPVGNQHNEYPAVQIIPGNLQKVRQVILTQPQRVKGQQGSKGANQQDNQCSFKQADFFPRAEFNAPWTAIAEKKYPILWRTGQGGFCRYFPGNKDIWDSRGCNAMKQTEHKIYVDGLCLKGYSYSLDGLRGQRGGSSMLLLCHGIPAAPQPEGRGGGEKDGGYPALAASCLQAGFNVFHFNFRGTGESEGNFDLAGWRRDLTAVLDYWEREGGKNTFLLWGFSAGAAVSCCVAARDFRVKALVMAASPAEFASRFPAGEEQCMLAVMRQRGIIRDEAFPPDAGRWLQNIHAASPVMYISAIAPRPLLIIHGEEDELVSCSHAHRLYQAAVDCAELMILPGAGHQLRRHPAAVTCCLHWLRTQEHGHFML